VICSLRPLRCLTVAIALACFSADLGALDPNRLPSQYVRQQWIAGSTFPGGAVNAIAQTADGYLWIGTDKGLLRFDGFSFSSISFTPTPAASDVPILQLLTDADGQLWVRPQGADVVHQTNGRFESIRYGGMQTSQVTAISKDGNGNMLVSDIANGTFRFRGNEVEKIATPAVLPGAMPPIISMAEGTGGKLWMGSLGAGLFYFADGRASHVNAGLLERKINCLLAISNDELWVGTDTGLFRWNGKDFRPTGLPSALGSIQILSMLRDRDSNIWVGTARGLLRINSNGTSVSAEDEIRGNGGINALFEDREGNLWVGGAQGLGRIRDSTFITYPPFIDSRFEQNGPVYVDSEGRAWFAPAKGGLYALKDGRIQSIPTGIPANDVVYSISGGGDELWVGRQHGGLTRLYFRNGAVASKTFTRANGLAQNSVYAVYRSHDGSVWAGTLSGGVSRFKDERFTNYTTANGLASNTISSILETRKGEMWFAASGGLSSLSNGQWKTYTTRDGLPFDGANCLFEDSSGTLWTGTSAGLAVFVGNRFQAPGTWPDVLRDPIYGMAEDRNGWLWIATSHHVLQVRRDKLAEGILGASDVREYGSEDGLPSSEGVSRSSSVVADSQGRIWFSLSRGISLVDPSHMPDSSPPAIAHVEGVLADGRPINAANPVRVPPSSKRIAFTYTALSLASPERIRFRYLVDDFDRNWSAPVVTREAVYTNLGPGSYRFRVIASNSSGLWNGEESAITFEVEPAVWQTWWFRSAVVVLAAFMTLLLYRLRMHRLTYRLNVRFEERLAERTRIARELHDTILQSFQGLTLHFQRARNLLPGRALEAIQTLDAALEGAEQAIVESRDAIHDLRSPTKVSGALEEEIKALGEELVAKDTIAKDPIEFRIVIEGSPCALRPDLHTGIFRIAREALRNAFNHSHGRLIETEIAYTASQFRLRIRDDGKGIVPAERIQAERTGHWGLRGMRERAEHLGGELAVWSEPGAGTEIELRIPALFTYETAGQHSIFWPFWKRGRSNDRQAS
jgi:signal transduction histidine kinase/ligand-binding sensor domain-containing protein